MDTNRTYISTALKVELKTNWCDFINHYRVEESKRLLRTLRPLPKSGEIARLSGFNSDNAYRNAFFKETGMTPSEYLKWWEMEEKKIKNTAPVTIK